MQPARASERQQRKLARVVPAFDRNVSQRALHICVRNRQNAFGRSRHAAPFPCNFTEICGKLRHCLLSAFFVKLEFAAEQTRAAEVAQHDVRIGDSWQQ